MSKSENTIEVGAFGNGRYSPVMSELYRDTQRLLGLTKEQAHTVSERLGIDLGRLATAKAEITYGKKVDKDGYRTVREVAKIKMPNSWALSIAVICTGLDQLRNEGLEVIDNTLHANLMEFVNKATAQRFTVPAVKEETVAS